MKRCGWVAVGYTVSNTGRCLRIELHSGSTGIGHAERMIGHDGAADFITWFDSRTPAPPSFAFYQFHVDTHWYYDRHDELIGGDLCFTLPYADGEEHRVWLQGELASGFVAAIRDALVERGT